jgi:hypothetical protein
MMTAKKRSARKALSPLPLSELPIMRALLAVTPPPAGTTASKRAIKGNPGTELRTLMLRIVDKIQVLALRRPQALTDVAKVVDELLDRQLEGLLDKKQVDRGPKASS